MGVVEDIITKCEEISTDLEFIKTLAGKAQDPNWVMNDPGYVHLIAIYNSAKTNLITKANELPTP